ncbi:uncharacterized protein [Coffea arabica]|uniref:Uncharacterized protein LOC113731760 isoform X1 n=1 Tax=Coffea arabica TaxID=13443 RepID=A0A6P6WD40_COFAR|nr:uncharacterized protein LOC113731760 isoform X1 [Coffea arabica]XP_027112981.1 uncharacterized protein LOC113731760 isoform X1 [Coffea arabica]XP_027112982.1 uncharacterized protein LOC113731760 isoform X1 [Coffea arabica]XP_027112983.1 uncharacterized protein LOC113731760 isoform X1 [Coffea arabica]XP_027112984.1 uncharacterized protein LOC113731760 isoform X1 [Coffea arabica]
MQRQKPNYSSNFPMNSARQLIDSLTSHLSLYHSSFPNSNPNPNPRSSIIKWFSSLSVQQRQAHLTAVDFKFTQTLLEMLLKLKTNGHGFFFILADIPRAAPDYRHASGSISLPSLLFRKSNGLLSRVAGANQFELAIRESIRLFSSEEGENVNDFSRLGADVCIDSITVSEEFVENVEMFVEIMDGVSNGAFLRGEESGGLAAEWPEMEWLKAKGYCSMETLVANRLEVALRLAWLNCNNSGKKRGVKLKEKINGAGVAANVFGRKKGCIDWWTKLDEAMKKKVFQLVVGKAAKLLTAETLKGKDVLENERMLNPNTEQPLAYNTFLSLEENDGRPPIPDSKVECRASVSVSKYPFQLKCMLSVLILLEDISSMLLVFQHSGYNEDKLFFSSLDSVSTTSDLILRKLRDILMVISLDCTKFELLEEGKMSSSTKKQKEKLGTSNHKKKGKNRNLKKLHSAARSSELDNSLPKPAKENGTGLPHKRSYNLSPSSKVSEKVKERNPSTECLVSRIDMARNNGSASRKSKKQRNKLRSSSTHSSVEIESCQRREVEAVLVSSNCQNGNAESDCIAEDPIIDNAHEGIGNDKHEPNSSNSTVPKPLNSGNSEGTKNPGFRDCQNSGIVVVTNGAVASLESVKGNVDCEASPSMPTQYLIDDLGSVETKRAKSKQQHEVDRKSRLLTKLSKDSNVNGKATPFREQGTSGLYDIGIINSSAYLSYEWPTVAPIQIPPCNSHLPAATDRLHLDVGYNWQNHFHQSFVPAVHRVRNSPVETGCSGITSQPLPMSLDWPPMVRGVNRIAPSVACNYDSGFISRRQSSFQQGFSASGVHCSVMTAEDERVCSSDVMDFSDAINLHELADDQDNQWMSEEELELHAVSGMDYNQYFGGGVMYWNPSDFPVSSFSRPPSLSSDDNSWAWREADMNQAVDDMVGFSSSYSTNGLTSPSAASFCSPFDPLGPAHQAVGYVLSENEIGGKVVPSSSTIAEVVTDDNISGSFSNLSGDCEAKTGDSLQYPILRPIIIPNIPREIPKSDFKRNLDRKSPCIPPISREQPRIKRPPSPVVLCVPRAPRPPPPSPVGDSRKHRGFPSVRSGSSSPRHWGVKGWSHDGINFEEACIRMDGSEVVWPSWRNKSLQARKLTQPVPGALLQDRLIAISQLARDQEHPDVAFPLQPPELLNCSNHKASLSVIHGLLHDEIDSFCKQVASENLLWKPSINWAVKRVTRSLQVLWPRSRTNIFGSNATGLSLPSSDVDLVVCLPPVRNLEPIKEAGILEGRNGIKETCLQHAARYLANQEWVKNDSLKIVENTAIPIIMLVVEVPQDLIASSASNGQASKEESVQKTSKENNSFQADPTGLATGASNKCCHMKYEMEKDVKSVRLDISFKSPSHTGLQTTELVKELTEQFPAAKPLALVLKKFLADRSLDQSYSGGLSSYCLVLLIMRFLQHEHHLGRSINQNYGSLLMDFLYFFGNVFDPRQMRISVQGSGVYINREQGYSIDPIYIDDPLYPANNVGRNCFRIHQCIKAFADAYSTLENELTCLPNSDELNTKLACKLLPKIIPSIGLSGGS